MKLKSTLLPIAVIACLIIYALFAIQTQTQQTFAINIDTAGAIAIQWPCEIAVIGDNGEKGLRIAPNIGRGWRGEAGGEAEYKFLVPADGKYHIWAYSLWFDECANAVFASIDGSEKTIIGNDPIYNKWHWVRGFDIDLKKGTHSLILSNHSDHIAIQKIVFLNNDYQTPQETGLVFSDIFYDGFDGCDQGNFSDWTILSGEWKVLPRPEMENRLDNTLVGTAQKNAFLIYQKDTWQSYSLNLSLKLPAPNADKQSASICFGVKDANNYYQLRMQPDDKTKTAKTAIIKRELRKSVLLSKFELPFETNKWQQLQININSNHIEVSTADSNPVKIETDKKISGGIGFLLKGTMNAYFDDIHIRKVTQQKEVMQ